MSDVFEQTCVELGLSCESRSLRPDPFHEGRKREIEVGPLRRLVALAREACSDETIAKTVQQRAWSSPIWFQPE